MAGGVSDRGSTRSWQVAFCQFRKLPDILIPVPHFLKSTAFFVGGETSCTGLVCGGVSIGDVCHDSHDVLRLRTRTAPRSVSRTMPSCAVERYGPSEHRGGAPTSAKLCARAQLADRHLHEIPPPPCAPTTTSRRPQGCMPPTMTYTTSPVTCCSALLLMCSAFAMVVLLFLMLHARHG